MTFTAKFAQRFGFQLWHPVPAETPNLRAFQRLVSTFETEQEISARLYAFEDQPLPGVVADKRPGNLGPADAPPEMPGRWLHHCFENEHRARWRWNRGHLA